jgi:hypothetical protein
MICVMRFPLLILCVLWLCTPALAGEAVPATSFFPVLPADAAPDATPRLVPIAANHPMQEVQVGVTRAIIGIHDDTRDANGTLAILSALAGETNESVLILAPQFMLPSDLSRFAARLPEQGRVFATWQMAGWPRGDDAVTAQGRGGVSSFTVVDLLLMYLADRKMFPDLRGITITGFGAGGNFVQRYAAFGMAADILNRENIDLRYVAAGASSYLYQTTLRPLQDKKENSKGFGHPDASACPDYNAYPYGLDKLNAYARRVGMNAPKTDYVTRFVTYLNTTAPDVLPDTNCAALAEGPNSAMRSVDYQAYLGMLYGDVASHTQVFALMQDASNDAVGLYGSACGMAVLFGDGICLHTFGEAP